MVVIREPRIFFIFICLRDWKDTENKLKHEIKFIIKSNEYLAENKIKTRLNNN